MSFPGIIRRLFANNGAGPKLRGDILPLNYGTCSTAAGTAAKVVSLPGFALATGAEVTVSFTVTNTASSPTLNVNGTGAKPIQYRNAAIAAGYLAANRTYTLVYDGVGWELVGDLYAQQVSDLIAELDFLRKLKIGAPRYHCSTTLPDRHAWINGDFIAFEDAPEFGEKYEAGGFDGMVMPWDADEKYQAAHLGQFRPDSANPTGLFLPVDGGQFFRNWTPGTEAQAGAWGRDEIRNITGTGGSFKSVSKYVFSGAIKLNSTTGTSDDATGKGPSSFSFDASLVVPTGPQVVPQHVWQPVCLYLGRPAQV